MISVQGYVDDTTIVGSAENAEWLGNVSRCYKQLRTAGFVVDGHSCYRSCRNSCMKFPARLLTGEELLRYWPQIDEATKFPTATTALERIGAHGYSVLLCRLFGASGKEGGVIVNLSFQQTLEICQGRNYSNVLALLAQRCTCKSKCAVITNTVLRTLALHTLENTQYGAHSIVSNTPALGLVLFSRKYLASDGNWQNFVEPCPLSMQGLLGNSLIVYVSFPGPKFPFRLAVLPSTPLSKALCSMQFRISGSPLKTLTSSGKLQ